VQFLAIATKSSMSLSHRRRKEEKEFFPIAAAEP